MSATTTIFILAFFIIAVVIGFSTFAPLLGGLLDADGFFVDTQLKPKPQTNEIICDLRVKVNADLDQTLPFSELFIRIDTSDSHDWTWFECFAQDGFPPLALLDFGENFNELSFLALGELTETGCITIVDARDPTQKVTPNTQPNLCREVGVAEEFGEIIPLPFDVSVEFVIQNIPLREYNLEITYDKREIFADKTFTANEPYITKICDQFSILEGSQCFRTG